MLLQTNSYIVPKEKRQEHARLMRRFRQVLAELGCDQFEVYEQVAPNWGNGEANGRFVQIMRFRDRKAQLAVQHAERTNPLAQALINEFCQLVDFQAQQQQMLFAVGFYRSVLPIGVKRAAARAAADELAEEAEEAGEVGGAEENGPAGQTPGNGGGDGHLEADDA